MGISVNPVEALKTFFHTQAENQELMHKLTECEKEKYTLQKENSDLNEKIRALEKENSKQREALIKQNYHPSDGIGNQMHNLMFGNPQ